MKNKETRIKALTGQAVHTARLLEGARDYTSAKDEDRIWQRLRRQCAKIEELWGADPWDQIRDRARALGHIRPIPGKDF